MYEVDHVLTYKFLLATLYFTCVEPQAIYTWESKHYERLFFNAALADLMQMNMWNFYEQVDSVVNLF